SCDLTSVSHSSIPPLLRPIPFPYPTLFRSTGAGLVRNFTFSGSNQINITQGTPYFIGVMWDDPSPGSGQTGAAYPQVQLSRATSGTRWENGSGYSYPNQPSSWTGGASSSGPIDAWLDVLVPD